MQIDYLDAATIFSSHVQSDGSEIGGVDPLSYGVQPCPGSKAGWLFWTEGNSAPPSSYPSVLFYPAASVGLGKTPLLRPILANTGNLALCFDETVGGNRSSANVDESDILIVYGGKKYNLSLQCHAANGEIDVGSGPAGWATTNLLTGAMTPNAKHQTRIQYAFNFTAGTCGVVSYTRDSLKWSVPANLQNQPGIASTWETGVYLQLQMGSLPSALPWSMRVKNIRLEWW